MAGNFGYFKQQGRGRSSKTGKKREKNSQSQSDAESLKIVLMNLLYKPSAIKQLKKLQVKEQKKIIKKLILLSTEPYAGKALKGELEGLYSLRAWPYRIVYEVSKKSVIIYSVVHRQGA